MSRMERIGAAVLYLGDCREILPTIGRVDAVVTDPPYGMNWNPDTTRFSGGNSDSSAGRGKGRSDFSRVINDSIAFDPGHLLAYPQVICWGANHYAQRLPVGTTLVWIKRFVAGFGSFLSDAEIAWEKGNYGVYCHQQVFEGSARKAESGEATAAHPTQKPVGLMRWCVSRTTGIVADPYMGSGTTGVACVQTGRPFFGIEIDPVYFETALRRIEQATRQSDLFIKPAAALLPGEAGGQ